MKTARAPLQKFQRLIFQLHAQPPIRVGDLLEGPIFYSKRYQGIYEIRDSRDQRTLYIGKTSRAHHGIAQRIWEHAHGGSDLLRTLQVDPERFQDFRVRSMAIPDVRQRSLAENFGVIIFDPPGNRFGWTW